MSKNNRRHTLDAKNACLHFCFTDSALSSVVGKLATKVSMPIRRPEKEEIQNCCALVITEQDLTNNDNVSRLQELVATTETKTEHIPVYILVGDPNQLEIRFLAAQFGNAYLLLINNPYSSIMSLRDTLLQTRSNPKILVIDDSPTDLYYASKLLSEYFYNVDTETDPVMALAKMYRLNPELILIDNQMPNVDGELFTRIVRQDTKFSNCPIIFLSNSYSEKIRQAAMKAGADDYIQKSDSSETIVSVIQHHLISAAKKKAIAHYDEMSGCLRREFFFSALEHLDVDNSDHVFALIDIDNFKLINDKHGHSVGDQVITVLGAYLQFTLRASDFLGRVGGEEFACIFQNCTIGNALVRLEELMIKFGEVVFEGENATNFRCTFSAGIVSLKRLEDKVDVYQRADTELYKAKRNGRNRIEFGD